jgi:eukaryotic-like serine/threonine-protein kinase
MNMTRLSRGGVGFATIFARLNAQKLPAAAAEQRRQLPDRSAGGFWLTLATASALTLAAGGMVSPSFASERGEQDRDEHALCERDRQANLEIQDEHDKCKPQVAGNWWPEFRSTPNLDGVYLGVSAIVSPSAQDLTPVWRAPTGGAIFSSPAVANVANGIAYVGSLDGFLHAFSFSTGAPLWARPVPPGPGGLMSSPAVANGVVFIGGGVDFRVHAFNATTGAPVWTALTGGPVISSPTVFNGVVYIGSDDKKVFALDAGTGALVWSFSTGGMVRSSPAVTNGVVYTGSLDGNVYALKASTGSLVWKRSLGRIPESSPAVANGLVYIGAEEDLFALNANNGAVLWRAPTGQGPSFASSPAVANGLVYIGSSANTVWAFNALSGGLVWSANVAASVVSSPAVVNNVVFVGSNDGDLHAYDAVKGTELWSTQTGVAVQSSPAVADGMVYVGSSDHFLYAFAASGDWPMFHHSPTLSGVNAAETVISSSNVGTLVAAWTACPTCIVRDPAVANGVVYAGIQLTAVCGDCLAAFDAATGTQLWRTPLTSSGSIRGTPAVWNGVVYIGAGNQRLYAFNAATGTQLWVTAAFGGPVDPPTVQNGLVYAVSEGSSAGVHARDPLTGGKVWDALIANVPLESPAVANENIYAAGAPPFTNKVFAYDAILGALLPSWPVTGGADRSAAFGDGKVYWGDSSGTITAFDAISGAKSWTASTAPSSSFIGSSAAVANGLVYVGAAGQVFALKEGSGAHAWSTAVSGSIGSSSPAVANGVLFICSDTSTAGTVQALNALSGALLWSATLPVGEAFSSPAVAHGMVYVGGSSGLHAYGLP